MEKLYYVQTVKIDNFTQIKLRQSIQYHNFFQIVTHQNYLAYRITRFWQNKTDEFHHRTQKGLYQYLYDRTDISLPFLCDMIVYALRTLLANAGRLWCVR